MYNKIIFFANDFGYGPTSNALSIARTLSKQGLQTVLVTAGENDLIARASGINIEHIANLRDVTAITEYLKSHSDDQSLIVSVMNRFAVTAANTTGRFCVLVDDLYWFWRYGGRPAEYENANVQVRCVLPWQLDSVNSTYKLRYTCVQPDISIGQAQERGSSWLYSFNGLRTPFYTEEHDIYVSFMGVVIKGLARQQSLVVAGPEYIRPLIEQFLPKDMHYTPLSKTRYLETLASVGGVYLNGGLNSFVEAVISDAPVRMLLPSNQSQYGLLNEIANEVNVSITDVCPLLSVIPNHQDMLAFANEREAIDAWSNRLHEVLAMDSAEETILRSMESYNNSSVINWGTHFTEWQNAVNNSAPISEVVLDIVQN